MLTTVQAAEFLQVHPQTLSNLRYMKRGPKFTKLGRDVFYTKSDLIKWNKERRQK